MRPRPMVKVNPTGAALLLAGLLLLCVNPASAAGPAAAWKAYLPVAGRSADLAPVQRVWGLQLMMEPWPEQHDADIARELPRARAAGLTAVRTNLRWDEVEPENVEVAAFDWSAPDRRFRQYADAGFELSITIIAYPSWATVYRCGYGLRPGMEAEWRSFVRAAAARYGRAPYRVAAWEIGNEPDGESVLGPEDFDRTPEWGFGEPTTPHGGCWGDRADAYRHFLEAAAQEIRLAAPGTPVMAGSLAHAPGFQLDFLDALLEAGGGPSFDVLGVHWYPDARYDPPDGVDRFRGFVRTMAAHGLHKPVWLTETYRLTHPGYPHTEANQIPFLTREIVTLLAQPELERVFWYGWLDLPAGVSDGVGVLARGIVLSDHTPKAAFPILPYTVAFTRGRPRDASTSEVEAVRFGAEHVVAWSRSGERVDYAVPTAPFGTVRVLRFPESAVMAGACCDATTHRDADGDGMVSVAVGRDSRFIEIEAP